MPLTETPEDRAREHQIVTACLKQWRFEKFVKYGLNGYKHEIEGEFQSRYLGTPDLHRVMLCEVKHRNNAKDRWRDYMITMAKIDRGRQLSIHHDVPFHLIIRWNDMKIWHWQLTEKRYRERRWGKIWRRNRAPGQDKEEDAILIHHEEFLPLTIYPALYTF